MDAASKPPPGAPALTGRSPLVGVSVCLDAGRIHRPGSDYWYLNRNYTRALARAGATPLLLAPDAGAEACAELCDGLVLSGGDDLPPSFSDPSYASGAWAAAVPGSPEHPERIRWERALLDAFAAHHKPVLGVCFGMQLMNLHFGGSLGQAGAAPLDHGGGGRSARHGLRVDPASPFFAGLALASPVSSSHRQAIARVAPGFMPTAWADDGVVEAIEAITSGDAATAGASRGAAPRLIGVEWHPESDASATAVYGRFVEIVAGARG